MFIIIGGDGKEYGPVTADQIRTWLAAGRADRDTKAKAVGSDEWRQLGDYEEFGGHIGNAPPLIGHAGARIVADAAPLASRASRIGGALINAFFYFLCTVPGSLAISRKLVEQYPELAEGKMPRLADLDLESVRQNAVWVLAGLAAGFLLQTLLIAFRGRNLGKLLTGSQVVRVDNGQPAGFLRGAVLRFLLPVTLMLALHYTTGLFGVLLLFVDFCFMFRADQRCLHDLVAGTKVVRA